MPEFIRNNIVCKRCWRPTMMEGGRTILSIGTIIIVRVDGSKEWYNVCSQHLNVIDDWIKFNRKRLPDKEEISSHQSGIQQFIPIENEPKRFDDIPMEKRKQYLNGEYIGKYSG